MPNESGDQRPDMTSRKSEFKLLATLAEYIWTTRLQEVFEELKDVTSKCALSKEHCGETPSRQIVFCNKDNTTFYSVIVAMFINGPSDHCGRQWWLQCFLRSRKRCRRQVQRSNYITCDQLQNDDKGETDRNALHKVLYFSLVMRKRGKFQLSFLTFLTCSACCACCSVSLPALLVRNDQHVPPQGSQLHAACSNSGKM